MKYCKDCKRFDKEYIPMCEFELYEEKKVYNPTIGLKENKRVVKAELSNSIRTEILNKTNIYVYNIHPFYFSYIKETRLETETFINVLNKDNNCKFYEPVNWFIRLLRK